MTPHRVLFLCTGNYYRSRFAEILFNHLAIARGLPHRADSAGLNVKPPGVVNHGALSPFAEGGLELLNIPISAVDRFPRQLAVDDFATSTVVVALKEAEHRPLLTKLHPEHLHRVTFWHVHDLDAAPPLEALRQIEKQVTELLESL